MIIARIEIVDYSNLTKPRAHIWDGVDASFMLLDEGRTLKVFIGPTEDVL